MSYDSRGRRDAPVMARPSDAELRTIVTDPNGAETLVTWANSLGEYLKNAGLTTSQIRSLFGEVRQIQAMWSVDASREQAKRRLILLKPKMAYRARRERGKAVSDLVDVLRPALDLVKGNDGNFQRFVEFFEAILAYHKAYGGS